MKVLLIIPPMTQLNCPYPSTAFLKGMMESKKVKVVQKDLSLELALELFSREGLSRIHGLLEKKFKSAQSLHPGVVFFLKNHSSYLDTINPVIRFLQGKDQTLAYRIARRGALPEGPRFSAIQGNEQWLDDFFGSSGLTDLCKYLCSLYLDDLTDVIREGIDPHFSLARYAERISASQPDFGVLERELKKNTLLTRMLDKKVAQVLMEEKPDLIGISIPFSGTLLGALRCAQTIRRLKPKLPICIGGGYVNTELRYLSDSRVFRYVDTICLDDDAQAMSRRKGKIVHQQGSVFKNVTRSVKPSYEGLKLDQYLNILELPNPMHRLWSDGRWLKLRFAQGCYWRKCAFCDVSLDYICRYEPANAGTIVDQMEALQSETGFSGFHFVDEAAPPALMKRVALEILRRRLKFTWWTNIRFEKAFDRNLCALLARSGCVAVTGGMEGADDQVLKLMNKGISMDEMARAADAFSRSGILVHAYLIYGFPGQGSQETVDALERLRQMFWGGAIHSAFWHQFALTVHSPLFQNLALAKLDVFRNRENLFASNDVEFLNQKDRNQCSLLGRGLRKATDNYLLGSGFDWDVREWFEDDVPASRVSRRWFKTLTGDEGND